MDNTKNRAINLHDLLFAQLENMADASSKSIDTELKRTKGMCDVADKLINLADLQLRALQVKNDNMLKGEEMPRLLVN